MIYLDSSVALARLFAEARQAPAGIWAKELVASRLLEYEVWNPVHRRGLGKTHADAARRILGRVTLIEMAPPVLARALEPFPTPVRTLDALHLATLLHVSENYQRLTLASFDDRMRRAASALGIALAF
jgi:predicted nucleic acid-binding protein